MNIFQILVEIVNHAGYFGIFLAVAAEYACFPVSSELLLPFIGYSISMGKNSLFATIIVSTLAGVIGSLFCYFLGCFGGQLIERTLCKRFKTLCTGVTGARRVFLQYGAISICIARVFPIARTYISIPAGMAKMDVKQFIVYTALGSLVWNTLLLSMGYYLGNHWDTVKLLVAENMLLVVLPILLLAGFIFYRLMVRKKKAAQ